MDDGRQEPDGRPGGHDGDKGEQEWLQDTRLTGQVGQPFNQVRPHSAQDQGLRFPRGVVAEDVQTPEAGRGDEVGGGVQDEGQRQPQGSQQDAANPVDHDHRGGFGHRVDGHGRTDLLGRDDLGQGNLVGRPRQHGNQAVDDSPGVDMPDGDLVGQDQDGYNGCRARSDQLPGDQQAAPVNLVGDDAPQRREQKGQGTEGGDPADGQG